MAGWFTETPSAPRATVKGWWNAADVEPDLDEDVGWWVGINGDLVLSIQFVTYAELQTLLRLNAVAAFGFNRSAVLAAVRPLALSRNLTVTMDLGMNGIYLLSASRSLSADRAATLLALRPLDLARSISMDRTLSLSKVLELGALQSVWTMDRIAMVDHIAILNAPGAGIFTFSASLQKIRTLDCAAVWTTDRTATVGFPPLTPVDTSYTAAGAYTYNIPYNAEFIDVVVLGAGAGGFGGNAFGRGGAGNPGGFTSFTLQRGVHIPWTTTQITGTVGTGGARVNYGSAINPGGGTTATGTGMTTLTGAGGVGARSPGQWTALAVGSVTVNGITYTGGAENTGVGQPGTPPGGGGTGGGINGQAGAGAVGRAWFRAY